MEKIDKYMSHSQVYSILSKQMTEAITEKAYPLVWELYGEAHMAYRLGAIRRFQYEKLWSMAHPVITKTSIVRKSESEDLKK